MTLAEVTLLNDLCVSKVSEVRMLLSPVEDEREGFPCHYGLLFLASLAKSTNAWPPPNSLSEFVDPSGKVIGGPSLVLHTPTTLGPVSPAKIPQSGPPNIPQVISLKWPANA
jgi:hypothetical protein